MLTSHFKHYTVNDLVEDHAPLSEVETMDYYKRYPELNTNTERMTFITNLNVNAFACKVWRFGIASFSFSQTFLEYQGIWSKTYFTDHWIADIIQLFVATKGHFSGLVFFLSKAQLRGIPQRLLDKCSHLFISISLK